MADKEEVFVTDLYKKHEGKEIFKGYYTIGKRIYQDDDEIASKAIALDSETLEVLRAKIMAILIDDIKPKSSNSKTRQTRLM